MPTGPRCADGFPNPKMQFRGNDRASYFSNRSVTASYSILIPDMKFTCNANITRVTVGGEMRSGNQTMKLRIWKKTARSKIYRKSEEVIDLAPDICDYENNRRYTCPLMDGNGISVECGDILGIELPPSEDADFELHSVPAPRLKNNIFEGTNLSSRVNLNDRIKLIRTTPLIFIMIRMNRRDNSGIKLIGIVIVTIKARHNYNY